jgi:hypothetical protein
MSIYRFITKCILILSIVFLIPQCNAEGTKITLWVITSYEGFTGYYIKNGEKKENFQVTTVDTYNQATMEAEIEDVDYLEISVTTNIGATSASIKIYKDNNKMKEESITGLDTSISHTLTMDYKYGEGEEEE